MSAIVLGREICCDLSSALDREWLVTNGIGGYASSTLVGANTRRYHGLLVGALQPPLGRTVLLAKIDEEVTIGDHTYYLGTNEYPNDTVHPAGFVHLQEVRLEEGIPTFCYAMGKAILRKTIWMEHGSNTAHIHYSLDGASPSPATLALILLGNYRDYHGDTSGSLEWNFGVTPLPGGCEVRAFPGANPYWLLTQPEARFVPTGVWYWHFVYRRERERGLNFMEDLYMPGLLRATLAPGESLTVTATTENPAAVEMDGAVSLHRARQRQQGLLAMATSSLGSVELPNPIAQLVLAADQFIVRRPIPATLEHANIRTVERSDDMVEEAYSLLAGYHWFGDWGRDAMISLPGLAVLTGRLAEAKGILRTFARYVDRGMIPNRFPDQGQTPEYNTVDATLWYFQALYHYLAHTADQQLLEDLFPVLADIISWHLQGTRYGIHMDEDGLLTAGEAGVQLTWMDAKVGDWVVTPRMGKPVEINALWYNALRLMRIWADSLGQPSGRYAEIARLSRESFARRFWYGPQGYLFDVVDGPEGDDPSLRPNQIFAVSLPYSLLDGQKARAVLEAVTAKLLTPRGLRSLSPDDPRYVGHYRGDQWRRDSAYHQGTVWAWLIGPYVDAHLRIYRDPAAARRLLEPFFTQLSEAGIGSLGEIFEGDAPHRPCGCISQAWSVAEVLRAWHTVNHLKEEAICS